MSRQLLGWKCLWILIKEMNRQEEITSRISFLLHLPISKLNLSSILLLILYLFASHSIKWTPANYQLIQYSRPSFHYPGFTVLGAFIPSKSNCNKPVSNRSLCFMFFLLGWRFPTNKVCPHQLKALDYAIEFHAILRLVQSSAEYEMRSFLHSGIWTSKKV